MALTGAGGRRGCPEFNSTPNPKLIDPSVVKKILQIILAAMQALEHHNLLMVRALKTPAWLFSGGTPATKDTQPHILADLISLI